MKNWRSLRWRQLENKLSDLDESAIDLFEINVALN